VDGSDVLTVTSEWSFNRVAGLPMPAMQRQIGAQRLRRFAQDLTSPVQNWVANERARSAAYRDEVFANLGCLPDD